MPTDTPINSKKEKILIIEGNVVLGEGLSSSLTKEGYEVTLVKNGIEGLKYIYDILPHLIILDVAIPGGDSYNIIAKKHAEKLLTKIPLFLLSDEGVPINMRLLPTGSVVEFIVTLHANVSDIVKKVNHHFGHGSTLLVEQSKNSSRTKKTLVWVEDDRLIGSILTKKLTSYGFNLIHVTNGEDAMQKLSETIPDAIILDILLPGLSGLEILQKIRDDIRLKNVPVIMLSNLSKPSDIERAKILGAKKFLIKAATSLDQVVENVNEVCV